MDLADIAQQRDERAYQQLLKQRKEVDVDLTRERFCVDCGELIAAERVALVPHCCRCVYCQEKAERR
ncbi:TraR/DksA C4-type zinc finger protein [Gallibacterium anatis]|uniref:TraR/DksA C4-type zinc finger protein n=1 Tax=Gallibacterium anatis TaxID=750 RepID=UPI0039FC6478